MIEVEILGTGTSTGVPQLGCGCEVCRSADACDKRLRCSAVVRTEGVNLLIDCGPDFRQQMLRASNINLDALLITHSHYDHVGGMDDLRPYCLRGRFPVYAQTNVLDDIRTRIPYCFMEHLYPGVPTFDLHAVADETFTVKGIEVQPLPVMHGKLPILGYRIGSFAYVTDAKTIPQSTMERMRGLDTLVINALRFEPHPTHMSLAETLDVIAKLKPRRALLIHESHGIGLHAATSLQLPEGVELAYDTEVVTIP